MDASFREQLLTLFEAIRSSAAGSAAERRAQLARKRSVLSWACTSPDDFCAVLATAPDMSRIFIRYFDLACRDGNVLVEINRASKNRIRAALKDGKMPPVIAQDNGIDYLGKIAALAQEAINKGYATKADLLRSLGQSISNI